MRADVIGGQRVGSVLGLWRRRWLGYAGVYPARLAAVSVVETAARLQLLDGDAGPVLLRPGNGDGCDDDVVGPDFGTNHHCHERCRGAWVWRCDGPLQSQEDEAAGDGKQHGGWIGVFGRQMGSSVMVDWEIE